MWPRKAPGTPPGEPEDTAGVEDVRMTGWSASPTAAAAQTRRRKLKDWLFYRLHYHAKNAIWASHLLNRLNIDDWKSPGGMETLTQKKLYAEITKNDEHPIKKKKKKRKKKRQESENLNNKCECKLECWWEFWSQWQTENDRGERGKNCCMWLDTSIETDMIHSYPRKHVLSSARAPWKGALSHFLQQKGTPEGTLPCLI